MSVQATDLMRGSGLNNKSLNSTPESNLNASSSATSSLPTPADSEASRAAGDARLAKEYAAQLLTGSRLRVPPESSLGRWIEALKSAFDSPVLKRLMESGDVQSLDIDPVTNQIKITYKGALRAEALVDIPGGTALFGSLMSAAKALKPDGVLKLPDFFKDDTVALSDVQQFYGESASLTPEQKVARSEALTRHPVFQGQGSLPDNDLHLKVLSGLGEARTLHNLLAVLKQQLDKPDFALESAEVGIAPYSQFWSEQQKQPVTIPLKQLLIAYGFEVPTTRDELVNLESALSAPPLRAPAEGDYGGLLSKEVPLDEDDQKKLLGAVNAWKTLQTPVQPDSQGRAPSLIEYLQRGVSQTIRDQADKDPEAFLQALVNTPQARALAKQLQEAINSPVTENSAQEVLLAALGLEADPAAGRQRNNLAGYNLRQQDNWGHSPAEIVKRFEKHLEARFGSQMAKVVAFQLLSMSAPEFLVKDAPVSLVYGSQQWASFSAAVLRREQNTPGSSAGRTYDEIMQHDALEPITKSEQSQSQFAAMQSVIDWGIANGVIEERDDETYSAETIDRAVDALQKQADALEGAAKAMAAPMPTRKELALAELRRVYGAKYERLFEDKTLLGDMPPGYRRRWTYSLLDIYMSGDLYKHDWTVSRRDILMDGIRKGFSMLPDINAKFDEQFNAYADRLKKASEVVFQYQLSQLPAEDRRMIEHGEVTLFRLEAPEKGQGDVRADHPIRKYIEDGATVIRAELNGKIRHYLYSPLQGKIIRNLYNLENELILPKNLVTFSMERPGHPGGREDKVHIRWPSWDGVVPKIFEPTTSFTIYPLKSWERQSAGPQLLPRADIPSTRIRGLSASVGAFYSQGMEGLKASAKGENAQERDIRKSKAIGDFILGFVPFYNSIKKFIDGKPAEGILYALFDIIGIVVPAFKGGSQAIKVGAKGLSKGVSFLKGFAKAGLMAANPLSNIHDVGRGVFKVGKMGLKKLGKTRSSLIDKLRHVHGRSGSFKIPHGTKKEPIAEGVYRPLGATTEATPTLAVQRNGKWYAYDSKTMLPYGAPLKNYTPSAWVDAGQSIASYGFDSAIDYGVDKLVMSLNSNLDLTPLVRSSTRIEQELQNTARQIADQAQIAQAEQLRMDVQQAGKRLAALDGVDAQELEQGGADILGRLDNMEAALERLEEQIDEKTDEYEVYFKRYVPKPIDVSEKNTSRERMNAIKQRLAVISKALLSMEKKRGEAA